MNDNFTFYLNNFQNLEKTFRDQLKDKFEKGKIDEFNLKTEELLALFNKLTDAMQKLEELKEHYETNFRNNNEISRKISIIEENISNYFMLQDFFNFKSQKEGFVDELLEKNSLDEISEILYSPSKRNGGTNKTSFENKNSLSTNDNPNELTSLLKKEIDKQDNLINDFNLIAKNIKKTNLELQNELIQQNKMLKKIDREVINTTTKINKSSSKFDDILKKTSRWRLGLFIFFEIIVVILIILYL